MNYTFQSFNFRHRQGARPFYDLVANIAAEEFGHIELVATAINTMLTGSGEKGALPASRERPPQPPALHRRRRRARCVQDSNGKPWNGDYVTSTGRPRRGPRAQLLPRDRRAQQQAQGLRDGRPPGGARADGLPARPRRRPPGRLRPRGREPHRRGPDEAVPVAADPDRQDPRVPAAHRARRAHQALPLLAERLPRARRRVQRRRTPRRARSSWSSTTPPEGFAAVRPARAGGRLRAGLRARGDRRDRRKLRKAAGLPDEPTGIVANDTNGVMGKVKEAVS